MTPAIDMNGDEEYSMPCAEALLAGTLALMTSAVQSCCDNHRGLIAQKIVSNLTHLSLQPQLSPDFRAMVWNLRRGWRALFEQAPATSVDQDRRLWHLAPSTIN